MLRPLLSRTGRALLAAACGLFSGSVGASSPPEGRPLFYWGTRPAVVVVPQEVRHETDAAVEEIHAALDRGAVLVRLSFDRDVASAPGSA